MDLMNRLHPLCSGEFDLKTLLQYEPPVTWRPKKSGEQLSGLVWKITVEENRGGYRYPVLHLLDVEQKLWKLSCAAVTLKKQYEKLKIVRGHLISCTFKGTGETDDGREYKKYTLEKT